MRLVRHRRGTSDGAAAVEFALIAGLLFMLLFGILQFGLTFNRLQGLQHASREGARLASLGATVTNAAVTTRVQEAAPAFILDEVGDLAITITPTDAWCPDDGSGNLVPDSQVTVSVALTNTQAVKDKYKVFIPFVDTFLPKLDASATFRCESVHTGAY